MKRFLLFVSVIFIAIQLISQTIPIANDDYFDVHLGETITVNVVQNDIHPNGLYFYVFSASNAVSFTDSTITYFIDYETYYGIIDTVAFDYAIKDENGLIGNESLAKVFLTIQDNEYYDFLDHNNIKAMVQASGLQFWPGPNYYGEPGEDDGLGYEFPKGSGKNTIFNSALWVGGIDDGGQLHLAAERYRQMGLDYWPGPLSINDDELNIDTSTVIKWQNVWKLNVDEVTYHKLHYWEEGYEPIPNIASWPAHGDEELNQAKYLAPFIDVDGDSIYNPMSGDYPLIRGEQCIYFIINDVREHTETQGEALGLEIHGMAYEFHDSEDLPMDNTVFFSYKIFNRSENAYYNTNIGLFTDFDLGYAWDDYVGCDVARGAYYGYNGDSIDGDGEPGSYGNFIPAQGIVILGGPLMDANGIDDPSGQCDESINGVGFGDGELDNERYGMKKFLWFNNSGGNQGDPYVAEDYYGYLQSIWKDGTAMEYGGNGHVSSGAYGPAADFMFPGLTDPCFWGTGGEEPYGPIDWTEETAENTPGDRRGLSVMGPFTFEPGSMERVDIAYIAAFPEGEKTAVETLMEYVDVVKEKYYEDPTYFGYQWLGIEEQELGEEAIKLIVYPNPASSNVTFVYDGKDLVADYKISDMMGKVILAGQLNKAEPVTGNLVGIPSGIYIITVTDSQNSSSAKLIKK